MPVFALPFSDMPVQRSGAGVCARRRSNFLLSRQEKVTKEKATLLCVSLRCATGNLRCSGRGCAAELTARLQRSVQTTAASQCTKCVCPSAHARTPCPALLGTHRREPATGHPHGPSLRSAPSARAQAPRAALSRPNAAMARMAVGLLGCWAVGLLGCWAVGLLGCHPPSVCAWGAQEAGWRGCAAGHTRASSTDSPRLSERSAAGAQ